MLIMLLCHVAPQRFSKLKNAKPILMGFNIIFHLFGYIRFPLSHIPERAFQFYYNYYYIINIHEHNSVSISRDWNFTISCEHPECIYYHSVHVLLTLLVDLCPCFRLYTNLSHLLCQTDLNLLYYLHSSPQPKQDLLMVDL